MKITFPAVILGCVLLAICGNPAQSGDYAQDVHERAWLNVAQAATSSKAHKYGIYQSRSIAVYNPEIYLNADALFNKLLLEISGMGSYYLERTQDLLEQQRIYESIKKGGGKRFRWSDFDINNHKKVNYKNMYHTNAILPFIDIRLHFLGTALKGTMAGDSIIYGRIPILQIPGYQGLFGDVYSGE